MTIDIPVHYLPTLERSLGKQGLAIRPYIKHGVQRWQLAPREPGRDSIPQTLVAAAEVTQ